MGSVLKGRCNNCNYETESLYYGGGFRNFKTTCNYPVLNKVDHVVQMANIMDRDNVEKQYPNLVFYDDEALSDKKLQTQGLSHEWGNYEVYYEGYLCPKCNQFNLAFEHTGCWD
jgi:hypothetical protein